MNESYKMMDMYKELLTDEDKNIITRIHILKLATNDPVEPFFTPLDFGELTIVMKDGKTEMTGQNIVISGRAEDLQKYLKAQSTIVLGVGAIMEESFEVINQEK